MQAMTITTLKKAKAYLERHEAFRASNLSAFWVDEAYLVFSYAEVIGVYNANTGEKWYNTKKYSMTTSKHQNLVKVYL